MMQRRRKKIGEILVAQGLITPEQLAYALEEHRRTGASLGGVLVKLGYITDDDLNAVLGAQIQLDQRKRIGEVLIDQGLITEEQVRRGLEEQKRSGVQLGKCLASLGFISEQKLFDALSAQLDIQHVMLDNFNFDRRLLSLIPEEIVRKYKVIPLFERDGTITVAMADPTNLRTIDHLKFKTGKEIDPVISTEKSIISAIEKNYSSGLEQMTQLLGDARNNVELDIVKAYDENESNTLSDEEGQQVVKIVNLIVSQAVTDRASDIHVEPMDSYVRLRYRVDGDLIEKNPIPMQLRAQITSRLKIMAGMDIAEKRKPQDGRFQIHHENREIDLRVSTFPVNTRKRGTNEKVVMRILDAQANQLSLDQIGFLPAMYKQFEEMIQKPDGIILVTGPTGSGKSSTLYAALQRVYDPTINIVTMEDPVEFNLEGINQGQINTKAGFTFAEGMRSILRQDPDIIMVGEMRDSETCSMAVQAALTGHLVFSTLHTNDSASAYTRLMDMGIEPFLLSSTIIGILAQRLIRRICPRCKQPCETDPELLARVGLKPGVTLYKGKGCGNCNNSGYKGRLGIYELLTPDDEVERMVIKRNTATDIRSYCVKRGNFDTLRRDGLRKALDGLTTIEQVLGATQND